MKIIVDANIPLAERLFGGLGDLVVLESADIQAGSVRDADALIVRSVTRVNADLLEGSRVRFVGTATAGTDHLDLDWLDARGITCASAPGSNAASVVEYVISALDVLAERDGWRLRDRRLAVVGCGHTGGGLYDRLDPLAAEVVACDPFLQDEDTHGDARRWVDLAEAFRADIVSLHVPLTRGGPSPTLGMVTEALIGQMPQDAVLVNTARGPVMPREVLETMMQRRPDIRYVVDVWDGEPQVSSALLSGADILTPHIAGYSYDGKVRGALMVHKAFCRTFGLPRRLKARQVMPLPQVESVSLAEVQNASRVVSRVSRLIYDVRTDDARFRGALKRGEPAGQVFAECRRHYPQRREFGTLRVVTRRCDADFMRRVRALGFRVRSE
jgi:erythronate-4-phosphate dehydrogenase